MMEILIAFILGMIVGGVVGLFVAGLMQAARRGDDAIKREEKTRGNNVRVLREEDSAEG